MSKLDTSITFNLGHNSNIFFIFLTEEVLKFETFRLNNSLQLLNIPSIFSTFEVSKRSISIIVRSLQDLNIFLIFVTWDVENNETFKSCNFLQSLNIESILVTDDVSKLYKSISIEVKLKQESNINAIFATFDVLNPGICTNDNDSQF